MHACVLIRSPQSFRVAILEGGYSGRYRGAVENFAAAARWGKPLAKNTTDFTRRRTPFPRKTAVRRLKERRGSAAIRAS